jgi:hypothetical protein
MPRQRSGRNAAAPTAAATREPTTEEAPVPERATTGIELLLSEPEIVAWLEAEEPDDPDESAPAAGRTDGGAD